MHARLLCLAIFPALAAPAWAIDVDGRIDPAEWQGAQHITDFKVVEPLTRAPSPYPTEAWVLATPEGLAIGFRNTQPASVPRTYRRTQRDEDAQVDRVNLMVDFDGDGRTGYNFTVYLTGGIIDATITNESRFSKDWDGNWQHAAGEDGDTWSVEMLIPWYIAPMRKGVDGKRTMGIYLDRVIGSTGQRLAWPAASFTLPRFLSDFTPVTVPVYSQSLLAVTPYVVGGYDNISGSDHFDAGADIVWKPNGQTQLTATLNPDFGQVESDDLVVNFGANETFFSDKRPFFTENQGIFEFGTPSDNSQLLYTRRVGGPADDASGPGDITAAIKLNGSLGAYKYGLFAAEEADDAGRSFRALRLVRDYDKQNIGLMLTQVDHPYLERAATVFGIDHNWRPTEQWNIQARLVGSQVDQAGDTVRGSGGTLWADYNFGNGWRSQWILMHFGDSLQLNDFGYLSRANLNYGHWQVSRRDTDLPDGSRYSSHEWRWRIGATDNDHGLPLQRQFRAMLQSSLRDGGNEYMQVNVNSAGYDDRILRGNGILRLPPNFNAFYERSRPRKGNWELYGNIGVDNGGIGDDRKLGYNAQFKPTYFISDAFNVFGLFYVESAPQWMVWQHDNLLGSFREHALEIDAGVNWTIGDRQELRVKLQAIGLDAKLRQAWRAGIDGTPIPSAEHVDDFSLRNLGFQVRYRYELAPLSDLYVVYSRGGYLFQEFAQDPAAQLRDAFALRDTEQLLVKLSYRFEL
jgi:hypothetical protein